MKITVMLLLMAGLFAACDGEKDQPAIPRLPPGQIEVCMDLRSANQNPACYEAEHAPGNIRVCLRLQTIQTEPVCYKANELR